ncbi:hypothetical protein SDJN03_21374, partial [Cucurbita argyrosperma subsp. sororia]
MTKVQSHALPVAAAGAIATCRVAEVATSEKHSERVGPVKGEEIGAPREEFRNGSGPGAYLSGRRWGQASQVAVTRFVHVDSANRRVSDEEEYKVQFDCREGEEEEKDGEELEAKPHNGI